IAVVHTQPVEREPDLVARLGVGALAGLGREEEAVAPFPLQPRRDVELRIAVARRRIEVVQVVAEHELEGAVGFGLSDFTERGGTEDRPPALMSGASEWRARYHPATIVRCADRSLESRRARRYGEARHGDFNGEADGEV